MPLSQNDIDHAALLLSRCRSGNPSQQRQARMQLLAWASRSESHLEHYDRLMQTDQALQHARQTLQQRYPRHLESPPAVRPAKVVPRLRRSLQLGLVLTLLAVLGAGIWEADPILSSHTYSAAGEPLHNIRLNPGSQVSLNAHTSLTFINRLRSRQILLHKGEALFQVEGSEHKPFRLQAESTRLQATLATFNLRMIEQGSLVTVLRGQLEVGSSTHDQRLPLFSNQQVESLQGRLGLPRDVDAASAARWEPNLVLCLPPNPA